MIDTKRRDFGDLAIELTLYMEDLMAEGVDPASIYTIVTFEEGFWRAKVTWVGPVARHYPRTLKPKLKPDEIAALRRAKTPAQS